ncbi:zonular occludens toxin domain-containing protein [Agathobaculum sp.]|uniref:zonular occludens toxin domain-containing protein n=1 Tax=Agathobaculum sp. TaxID=2048138 RepID=UPI002A7F55F9|nr:zonular occludens toxin domain-containing protein [Agathobaculum sp.]MDY3618089.1 zonular occludens toxin domain-containing protein [Agathobaculum sp.]
MIYLYSGTPGSGKSYHSVKDIWDKLHKKERNRVIANFSLGLPEELREHFTYLDNPDITIDYLMSYAREHHKRGIEGQTLVVIDEAQCIFNSRDWNGKGILHESLKKKPDTRMDWIKFFSQHRHLGYNFILVAQSDKMIDKQIRVLIEYDVKHLKANNGFFFFLPTTFVCVERWYGQNMKLSTDIIPYRKKIAQLYDSYALFDTLAQDEGGQGEPRSGGHPPAVPAAPEPTSAQPMDKLSQFFGPGVDPTQ